VSTNSIVETMIVSENPKSPDRPGWGPVFLLGMDNGLYERHLLFDNVIDRACADSRDRFEALARAVRDILSERWVATESTYERLNPKRVYYLSMEFLIGRSLANNVTNLFLDPVIREAVKDQSIDWPELLEEEPDAALGNGGLGRLAACFLDSMATMQLPAMGYGLRYEYGMFKQAFQDGWQREQPDNWLRRSDPWEVARPHEKVEVKLNCSFEARAGELCPIQGRPSSLIGIPYDRPVVRYGAKPSIPFASGRRRRRIISTFKRSVTANSLAPWRRPSARSLLPAYCIRTTRRAWAKVCGSCRNTSWWPARWPISCAGFSGATPIGTRFQSRWRSNSTIPTQRWRFPS